MKEIAVCLSLLCMLSAIGRSSHAEGYVIGEKDKLHISVWGNPELKAQLPVRPDGMISLPLVGDVMASGKTPSELKKILEKEFSKFLKAPVVSVMVMEVNSYKSIVTHIRVVGEVKTPGLVPFSEGMTALDAVLSTGGFTEFASRNSVVVVRAEGNTVKKIKAPLKDVMNGALPKNVLLKPGDLVSVRSGIF